MSEHEDGLTIAELIAVWDRQLSPTHYGRILIKALIDMENAALEQRVLLGAEGSGKILWRSFLSIGTTFEGSVGFCMFPEAGTGGQIRDRDKLLDSLSSQHGRRMTQEEACELAPSASTTIAIAYYGVRADRTELIGIAWRQGFPFANAISHLKLALAFIREAEAKSAKGGN